MFRIWVWAVLREIESSCPTYLAERPCAIRIRTSFCLSDSPHASPSALQRFIHMPLLPAHTAPSSSNPASGNRDLWKAEKTKVMTRARTTETRTDNSQSEIARFIMKPPNRTPITVAKYCALRAFENIRNGDKRDNLTCPAIAIHPTHVAKVKSAEIRQSAPDLTESPKRKREQIATAAKGGEYVERERSVIFPSAALSISTMPAARHPAIKHKTSASLKHAIPITRPN